MRKSHLTIAAAVVLFVLLAAFTLRPVPTVPEKECLVVKARVAGIYEGGVKDVVFVLSGHKESYYINRGLERGLSISSLKQQLEGKEVTIKYPNYWSVLDPSKSIRHIAKVEYGGKTIFSETE